MRGLEPTDSAQVKFIYEWGQGFEKRDLDLIAKHLHKDYRHTHYPRSLGQPEQNKEQWLAQFKSILGLMTESEVSYIKHDSNPLRHG